MTTTLLHVLSFILGIFTFIVSDSQVLPLCRTSKRVQGGIWNSIYCECRYFHVYKFSPIYINGQFCVYSNSRFK